MQYSDTTNKNGIIQDEEILLGFGDGGISGDTTRLKQMTSLNNLAYHKASIKFIQNSSPGFIWDDLNYTSNFPRGSQDLVVGQKDYALPTATGTYSAANASTLLTVLKIAVLDSNGQEKVLAESSASEAELNTYYNTNGQPEVYKLINGSVKVWPAPASGQVTTTNGLVIYFQRSVSEFVYNDTTKTPGIPVPFHRFISLQGSLDYAATHPGMESRAAYIQSQLSELVRDMEGLAAQRNKDTRIRFTPASRRTSYQ
jgi:hypothetical protein